MENPNRDFSSPSSSSSPSSVTPTRLWRPAAQRNLGNQWSYLLSGQKRWISAVSEGRSNATELVNAYLSQRYLPEMDFGIVEDMPEIREHATRKLAEKQDSWRLKLLSSYKNLVAIVCHLVNTSNSMRCFLKGSATTPLVRFSNYSENPTDLGDGGGISVFTFWPISHFETLAREFVDMFCSELLLKRLLVVKLLSVSCQHLSTQQSNILSWSGEIYPGEFNALNMCNLISKESQLPVCREMEDSGSFDTISGQFDMVTNGEVLQSTLQDYLTLWFSEVYIDTGRVEDILRMVGEEMHVILS